MYILFKCYKSQTIYKCTNISMQRPSTKISTLTSIFTGKYTALTHDQHGNIMVFVWIIRK